MAPFLEPQGKSVQPGVLADAALECPAGLLQEPDSGM